MYCWKTVCIVGRLYVLLEDCTYFWKTVRIVFYDKGNEVGVACVGGKREACTGFWSGSVKERGCTQDLVVDGRSVLKMGRKTVGWEVVDRIDVAQSRNKW
jgi:hypothetical protein